MRAGDARSGEEEARRQGDKGTRRQGDKEKRNFILLVSLSPHFPMLKQFLLRRFDAFQSQVDSSLASVMGLMLESFAQGSAARRLESAEEFNRLVHFLQIHTFSGVDHEVI